MSIYTETYGGGETLILVHGWAMHTGIWRSFAQQLGQYYQVICVDLPGHGRSAAQPFTLQHIRAALLAALPERPCYWLGWSLGANIVLDIAEQFPGRVKGIVLLAGNPCFLRSDHWPGMDPRLLENFAATLQANCQAALLRFLALQLLGMDNHKELLSGLKQTVYECAAPDLETLQGGLAILECADMRPVLEELSCPLCIILGARDTLVPVAVGAAAARLVPAAMVQRIEKAGHVPFLTHAAQVIETISAFMEDNR